MDAFILPFIQSLCSPAPGKFQVASQEGKLSNQQPERNKLFDKRQNRGQREHMLERLLL